MKKWILISVGVLVVGFVIITIYLDKSEDLKVRMSVEASCPRITRQLLIWRK